MRRVRHTTLLAGLVAPGLVAAGLVIGGASGYPALAATANSPAGSWGTAINVPGTSAAAGAQVASISCAPGAQCMAVGNGLGSNGSAFAFAITEKNGAWGKAAQVPAASKLGQYGAEVTSLSCPANGDCLAVGTTLDAGWYSQEIRGHWGNATYIPGLKSLPSSDFLLSLLASCSAPGKCAVTGEYLGGGATSLTSTVLVASETSDNKWVPAVAVTGMPSVTDGIPIVTALACASAGNCVIGGGIDSGFSSADSISTGRSAYALALSDLRSARSLLARDSLLTRDSVLARVLARPATASDSPAITELPFVASEVGGNWQSAVEPSLPSKGIAAVTSAACPPGGECVVAGIDAPSVASSPSQVGSFLISQQGDAWSAQATNSTLGAEALACPTAGDCTAAGLDVHGIAAVARENNGKWGSTTELHGAASLSYKGKKASLSEVAGLACPSVANCSVVGRYSVGNVSSPAGNGGFVGGEANGTWSSVTAPASLTRLNSGGEATFGGLLGPGEDGLACASAANCAAGGFYATAKDGQGAFLIAEVPQRATATTLARSHSIVTYDHEQLERLSVAVTSKPGTPGGRVTIKAGAKTVCTITLRSGKGSCTLSARQFRPGGYHLVADFTPAWPYARSASSSWPLTVKAT